MLRLFEFFFDAVSRFVAVTYVNCFVLSGRMERGVIGGSFDTVARVQPPPIGALSRQKMLLNLAWYTDLLNMKGFVFLCPDIMFSPSSCVHLVMCFISILKADRFLRSTPSADLPPLMHSRLSLCCRERRQPER